MDYKNLKILYTTKDRPDYLYDAIYLGLVKLGCIVQDIPHAPWYHGVKHSSLYSIDTPEEYISETDLMIINALGYDNNMKQVGAWCQAMVELEQAHKPKKVIIVDGSDHMSTAYPAISNDYTAIFKRELLRLPYPNWYPISFCALNSVDNIKPFNKRKYDVSCILSTPSNPYRQVVADAVRLECEKLELNAFIHSSSDMLSYEDYVSILRDSKTSVSVKGLGWDCYRYWEIPAHGTVLISDISPLIFENDFNGEMCFRFEDTNDFPHVLREVKRMSDADLEYMAKRALGHTKGLHTPEHRARYVLDKSLG